VALFGWEPWAIPSGVASVVAFLLARQVWVANHVGSQNRRLTLVLVAEGVLEALAAFSQFTLDHDLALRVVRLTAAGFFLMLFAYLFFLATIDVPLTRPLRTRTGNVVLGLLAVVVVGLVLFVPDQFVTDVQYTGHKWNWLVDGGALMNFVFPLQLIVPVFGLFVSASAYRRAAAGTAAKKRARSYSIAFGTRDALYACIVLASFFVAPGYEHQPVEDLVAYSFVLPVTIILTASLLAYGILKSQLFDIDLKIRWGAARGTVAGVIVVLALIVSKITEFYLNKSLGIVFGGVAAGVTLFMAPRLNKFADKVATKAAPQVSPTPEYVAFRKLEVYKAAFESAVEQGELTDRDRAMLLALRSKLALKSADADAVEIEVRQVLAPDGPRAASV
jgi:hypothetical protein